MCCESGKVLAGPMVPRSSPLMPRISIADGRDVLSFRCCRITVGHLISGTYAEVKNTRTD